MDDEDVQRPARKVVHAIGEDLATLSIHELEERIVLLNAEAGRLAEAIAAKKKTADAAASLFATAATKPEASEAESCGVTCSRSIEAIFASARAKEIISRAAVNRCSSAASASFTIFK